MSDRDQESGESGFANLAIDPDVLERELAAEQLGDPLDDISPDDNEDDSLIAATGQVAAYGAGMGLLVTALTVSLAVARTGLLGVLRASMQRVEQVAAGFVILSGLYLAYYFWVVDIGGGSDPIVEAVDRIQRSVIDALQQRWQLTAVVLGALVLAAGVYSRRPARGRD